MFFSAENARSGKVSKLYVYLSINTHKVEVRYTHVYIRSYTRHVSRWYGNV